MSAKKDLRTWRRSATRMGWTVTETGGGHLRWRSPAGEVVITPATPGEGRSMLNVRSSLRRAGLRFENGSVVESRK